MKDQVQSEEVTTLCKVEGLKKTDLEEFASFLAEQLGLETERQKTQLKSQIGMMKLSMRKKEVTIQDRIFNIGESTSVYAFLCGVEEREDAVTMLWTSHRLCLKTKLIADDFEVLKSAYCRFGILEFLKAEGMIEEINLCD